MFYFILYVYLGGQQNGYAGPNPLIKNKEIKRNK